LKRTHRLTPHFESTRPLAALFCLAALARICTAAPPAAREIAAKPVVDLRQHPTGGKTPLDVSVGLYITNLVSIDETRESFEVGGYLTAKWNDPRLALAADPISGNPDQEQINRHYRAEDIWTPPIQAANSISHSTRSGLLEVDRNGEVTYTESFDAVLSNDFALRKFPFDTQVLRFEFQPFLSASSGIRFAAQALPSTGMSPEQHTELAAWRVKDLQYSAEKMGGRGIIPETREALFQIVIERRSGFYVWKILLPLLLMTMIPSVVFWMDVKEFDWTLKVPMTMLLSMVALEFAVARDLPRIGYVTFLDALFLASYFFCFLCILEITVVFLMQERGRRPAAEKLHRAGRWGYPLAYFLLLAVLALSFLA
jgi:hypothetical protein